MNALDNYYATLLERGFIVLKQAVQSGDPEWVEAELEMLHNVPSLIGEDNVERHRYFWFQERGHYIEWSTLPGHDDAKSRMRTYYEPLWREMEPLVNELVDARDDKKASAGKPRSDRL